jgi:excisionase family DNA binding protein
MAKDKDANEPRLMTAKEAAAYCGVSAPTLRKWVADGSIPGPVNRLKRFDRHAIDAALDKASGLAPRATTEPAENALDKWIREQAEKEAAPDRTTPRKEPADRFEREAARVLAMSHEERVAESREWRRRWAEAVPKSPVGKRERDALRQLYPFGTRWTEWRQMKGFFPDTMDRLAIRGFVETKPHSQHPNSVLDFKLTDAGLSAAKEFSI